MVLNYLLTTTYFLLLTSYFLLLTSYFLLLTSESLNRPKSLSRTLFRESSAKLILSATNARIFFAKKALKHQKPQIFFESFTRASGLESFESFESLNL